MRARHVAAALSVVMLSACAEFDVVATTPVPSAATLALPPIGFNHRYGNNPLASRDGYALERQFFAAKTFWEVGLHTEPPTMGFVNLGNQAAVAAARHDVTSLVLVIATEERGTIAGLLDNPTHAGQEAYAEAILGVLRDLGYDGLTSAQVQVYFSEKDKHAQLNWTPTAGYSFAVYDNDLKGTSRPPVLGGTPLPTPAPPTAPPSPPVTATP